MKGNVIQTRAKMFWEGVYMLLVLLSFRYISFIIGEVHFTVLIPPEFAQPQSRRNNCRWGAEGMFRK